MTCITHRVIAGILLYFWLLLLFHLLNKCCSSLLHILCLSQSRLSLALLCKSIFTADRNPRVDHYFLTYFIISFFLWCKYITFLSVDKHFTHELSEAVLQQLNSAHKLVSGFKIYL